MIASSALKRGNIILLRKQNVPDNKSETLLFVGNKDCLGKKGNIVSATMLTRLWGLQIRSSSGITSLFKTQACSACSACRTGDVSFFTLAQMCTTSYVFMQVSRNLADNNTPQLCLLNAQNT